MFARLRLLLLSSVLLTSLSAAPAAWVQMKVGMTGDEVISLVGTPVMRTAGRGFETWTYDDGAEVLVYGRVVGWTLPASANVAVRSDDVWRSQPRGDFHGTLQAAVRQAAPKPALPAQARLAAKPGIAYAEYSHTRG